MTQLLDAFERTPLIAVGDRHGLQELADFLIALIHHPRFPQAVQAIVVEFGNARYQALMDRFISGAVVANQDLRPVWRDIFSWVGGDAPIYEQLFRTVRAINRGLSPARHVRVLLGDPPIHWEAVQDWRDIEPFLERDRHFAGVVEQEVISKSHRALLITGVNHIVRTPHQKNAIRPNLVDLLDAHFAGLTSVIVPHVGFATRNAELEWRLGDWRIPTVAWVGQTWLGELDSGVLFAAGQGQEITERYRGWKLQDAIDGYLYLGPRETLSRSQPNPAIYRGDAIYLAELERRRRLFYASHTLEELFVEKDPHYYRASE